MRKCKICGKTGHNARTCKSGDSKSYSSIGHAILKEANKKEARVEINGIKPQKGVWLVNLTTKKVMGQIQCVKKSGKVVWRDFFGAIIESEQETISGSGYSYFLDMPSGDDWLYMNCGGWTKDSTMRVVEEK